MKTTFKNNEIEVTAKLKSEGVNFPNSEETKYKHNKFRVTVSCNGKKEKFDFYGSHNDWENGKITLDDEDLINALYCFMSDGLSGNQSFEDFASGFGYDTDSRKAYKIYKQCVKTFSQLENLFDFDLYDFINHLQEEYNV